MTGRWRRRRSWPCAGRSAAAAAARAGLAAEPDLLGKGRALRRVVGGHHGVIRRQAPLRPIAIGRQLVSRAQVALQHLELLAVLKTDDVVGRQRFLDGYDRLGRLRLAGAALEGRERAIDRADDLR